MRDAASARLAVFGADSQRRARLRAVFVAEFLAGAVLTAVGVGCAHTGSWAWSHPGLTAALNRLQEAERARDWSALHAMLSPEFERGRSFGDFVVAMNAYSSRLSLVSWRVVTVSADQGGKPTSAWVFVEGCGCYRANGEYQAWVTNTIAVPEGNGWRFDGIRIAGFADISPPQCPAKQVPQGPCRARY